jgi:hypothetical protein
MIMAQIHDRNRTRKIIKSRMQQRQQRLRRERKS